ncbi:MULTISPECIES: ATP-binding cassette domain-containing protein [unclassified Thermotoga]|uniref:ABC transporter ATP-binding protein n=1 Tax=unclassified Thermotoga TaxID=2631113 RepID=UPI000280E788|nr:MULTISPECIES: ATP-binding cassette domain-containing protein [unclassified Thermotoga]AIY87032.1 ABC transporter [Thermotoga sp. 2812B]EJX25749.1 ABC transporter [Thermotoga sp. EMP]
MLRVIDVWKKYPPKTQALKGVSFDIENGTITAVFGENGSGKTTLLKIIASFLIPDRGRVLIDDVNIVEKPSFAVEKVSISTGYERSFYYRLTVEENLKFFGMLNDLLGRTLKRETERVMKELGLLKYRKKRYMELSTGYKKRVDVARALMKRASIYIFDEPCSGVDLRTRLKIHEIMKRLKESGRIVIFASHDLEDLKIADRVIILKKGEKVLEFSPKKEDLAATLKGILEIQAFPGD